LNQLSPKYIRSIRVEALIRRSDKKSKMRIWYEKKINKARYFFINVKRALKKIFLLHLSI